jgi:hypothetical protein
MFYLFNRYLFVEIESKEGRKTALLVIKQLQQISAYRKFRKWKFRNRERLFLVLPMVNKINANRPTLDFFDINTRIFLWPYDLVKKRYKQSWMLRKHTHIPDNDYWEICLFHVVRTNFFLQLFLCGLHGICIYFFSSTEHCAWAIISLKEFKSCVISFALLYWKTELSAVK